MTKIKIQYPSYQVGQKPQGVQMPPYWVVLMKVVEMEPERMLEGVVVLVAVFWLKVKHNKTKKIQ